MHKGRQTKLHPLLSPKLVLFFVAVGLVISGFSLLGKTASLQPPQKEGFITVKSSPPPIFTPPICLAESEIEGITEKKYVLQREEFFSFEKVLECSYLSDDQVNTVQPSVRYRLYTNLESQTWETKQYELSKKNTYRTQGDFPNLYITINPVYELQQATFYLKDEKHYVEVTYTPVRASEGELLDKGRQISQKVLERYP